MNRYLREFGASWSNLLGAALGVSMGISLFQYTMNIFGPPLMKEFGWSRAQFALLGAFSILNIVLYPVIGRLVDRYGPRVTAAVGFTAMSLALFAFSVMTGNILEFYVIYAVKSALGIMTSSLVFSRVVVERFEAGRGLALSLTMSAPPLAGSAMVLIAGQVIEAEGWRTAYRLLAILCALAGAFAVALIGRSPCHAPPSTDLRPFDLRMYFGKDVLALLRQPVFVVLFCGMFLVNLPQSMVSTQLSVIYQDMGLERSHATWLISLYPVSVLVGRLGTGLALDRMPSHVVAGLLLGMPAIALAFLATSSTLEWVLVASVLLIGLAQGAEGDVGAFLTSRKFDITLYGFVYSMLVSAISLANALGSLLLSATLLVTDAYHLFLVLGALATVLGALLFLATGRYRDVQAQTPRAEAR